VTGVSLAELVREGVAREVRGDASVVVHGVQHDSRRVVAGELFAAIPGTSADGSAFVAEAVQRGAAAVLLERGLDGLVVPQVIVADARRALGHAAAVVFGHPTFALDVVGITGTNGKTTTSYLVEAAIAAAGGRPAVMGTVTFRGPGIERVASHTTPEGDDVARFAREVVDAGASHLVMEVSSHGLALHRVDAVRFRVAAFTNLTQDHLDFHGDLEKYGEAKARLFVDLDPGSAVLNVDDPFGAALAARVRAPRWRVSMRAGADAEVRAVSWTAGREGIRARVTTPRGEMALNSPLLGAHNLENLLVALGCALALDLDPEGALRGLAAAKGAPGRLERVEDPRDVAVLVDYAHTPDALARALAALRPVTPGRLLVVFGCGGDRDRGKRPQMGEAAARGADVVVVTSDNPRTEVPGEILKAIEPGVHQGGLSRVAGDLAGAASGYVVIEDRREAIAAAIGAARAGDTVLIAGKGHEDYQIVGTTKRPFDDRIEAARAIAAVATTSPSPSPSTTTTTTTARSTEPGRKR
jgi:UDP-N-acetylmuramoyl-L-alanyl-D-glutamate--2,6-diaminopimelate ligase